MREVVLEEHFEEDSESTLSDVTLEAGERGGGVKGSSVALGVAFFFGAFFGTPRLERLCVDESVDGHSWLKGLDEDGRRGEQRSGERHARVALEVRPELMRESVGSTPDTDTQRGGGERK